MKAFEEPKQGSHNIEVVLREPEWLKLRPPEPVTIEHERKAPDEANGALVAADAGKLSRTGQP